MVRVRRKRYGRGINIAMFEELASVDALKTGGVGEEQADVNALAFAMRESAATKADLDSLAVKLRA